MKIILAPLFAKGYADLEQCVIFLSTRYHDILNTFIHELAHIITQERDHGFDWHDKYLELDGNKSFVKPIFDSELDVGNVPVAQNIGNITGIQNLLLDYHYLQHYRKFSQRILGTEGQWEFIGDSKLRLFPTPRGTFPVAVEYIPVFTKFKKPSVRELTKRAIVAELKIMVGNSRRKFSGIPSPDGGTITLDGAALAEEGRTEKKELTEEAWKLGEPMPIILW